MAESQVQKFMRVLGLTEAEALELVKADEAVDKMKDKDVNSDLTDEQQKVIKKARQADRKPFVPKLEKRARKANEPKRELIEILRAALEPNADGQIEVTNPERELNFTFNGTKYKVVLSAPRK